MTDAKKCNSDRFNNAKDGKIDEAFARGIKNGR